MGGKAYVSCPGKTRATITSALIATTANVIRKSKKHSEDTRYHKKTIQKQFCFQNQVV